ncbi:MAG TPA: MFS transporter, partial [Aquaticitalea sp.]|nr:MFS transporter [Aquaticitalea sp.]
AMYVALNTYSKPENKTRSVTLMRLAINLGFSAGPAIGGLIITKLNYHGLFWVDGLTCVMASFVLLSVLHPKKSRPLDDEVVEQPISAYSDKPFLVFFLAMVIFGTVFLQLLSTLPFYYKNGVGLSEFEIGMLMTMNGFLIFVVEMPLIKWLESSRYTKPVLLLLGIIMTSISFALLLPDPGIALVITSLIIFTFGEMIVFPFSNSFSLDRAKKGRKGEYMALYSVSFSVSHLIAHNLGFHLIDSYGFSNSWLIMFCLGTVGVVLLLFLRHMLKKESLHKA